MASPVPFIQNVGGKFQVTNEASTLLSKVRGKLAIVCVAGPYRTGKSFLLNTLVGRQDGKRDGFQVGGSVRACTKGIWLWGEPVRKGDATYIFMDSEGLGSTDQHITFDTQILSLAILLSSFFILNTQGTITEQTLAELELVVKCSERIRRTEEKHELGDIFPDFLWVLRDFALQLQDENDNPITAKEYLEQCLRNKAGAPAEKNRIRDAIKDVFRNRDCRTLVRPITEEDKLQKLPTMPWSSLRPEFRTQVESLCGLVYSAAKPKQVEGGFVNGAAVIGLAEAYVQALNTGKMPVIHTAWQSVVMQQSAHALETALQVYEECFNRLFAKGAIEEEAMYDEFLVADEAASVRLRALSVGDESQLQEQVQRLVSKATLLKKARVDLNKLQSKNMCQQVIDQLWSRSNLEGKDFKSASDFEAGMQAIKDAYYKKAVGPCKDEVARVFFETRQQVVARSLFVQLEHLQLSHAALLVEKKKSDDKLATAIQQAEAAQKQHQLALETAQNQYRNTLEAKQLKYEALQTKHDALQEMSHKSELDYQGKMHSLESHGRELSMKLETLSQNKLTSEQKINELKQKTKELNSSLEESEQRARELSGKLRDSEQQIKDLNGKVDLGQQERVRQVQELTGKLGDAQKAHGKLEKDAERHARDLQTKLDQTQKSARDTQEQLLSLQKDSETRNRELLSQLEEMKRRSEKAGVSETMSQKTIHELQESQKKLTVELSKLQRAGEIQIEELSLAQSTIRDLQQKSTLELSKAGEEVGLFQRTIHELQESKKNLTAELSKTRDVAAIQNEELAMLRSQKASTEQVLQELKGQCDKMRADLDTARKDEAKAVRLERQIAKLEQEKRDMSVDVEHQITALGKEKAELNLKLLTKAKEQEVALSYEKAQCEKKLAQRLEQNQTLLEDMKHREDQRITELEQRVEDLQRVKSEADQSFVQKVMEIGALEKDLDAAKAEVDHFSQIKTEMEQLTKDNRELAKENAELRAAIARSSVLRPMSPQSAKRKNDEESGELEVQEPQVRFVCNQENIPPPVGQGSDSEDEKGSESYWKKSAATIKERRKRQSLAPAPENRLKNPEKCTVNELMSWLTSMDVELPATKQKKQFYLDLLYKAEPELRAHSKA